MRLSTGILIIILGISSGCMTTRLSKVEILESLEGQILTWPDAVRGALEHNPDLKKSRAEVKSLARSRDSAAGAFLPSATGTYDRSRSKSTGSSSIEQSMDIGFQASQPIFAGFQIVADFLKASRELSAEEYAYLDTSANVRFRLRSAYIDLLRLEELFEVSEQIVERRKQNAELIQLRYDAGREHQGSLLRSQAIVRQAVFELDQTRRAMETQSLRFSRELGGAFISSIHVEGNLEEWIPKLSDPKPNFTLLAQNTPAVQQLIKLAEAKKAEIVSAQSVVWPQVNGTYDYGYSGDRASNLDKHYSLGLGISVPLFEGGRNLQAIRKAKADYDAAREAAESARDETLVQLAESWAALENALDSVDVRRKFLEAAEERAEIIKSQYTSGLVNFQDFDLAEQDLADSQKSFVEALAAALTREASLDLEKGSTLEEIIRGI